MLPCASVMVIIVLLNARVHVRDAGRDVLALAPADAAWLPCPFSILSRLGADSVRAGSLTALTADADYFFLPAIGLGRPLAGAGVGVGALAAHRQAPAMTQAAIAAEIHQPLDVHRDFAAQIALDHVVAVDHLADVQHLLRRSAATPAARPEGSTFSMISSAFAGPMPWMYCSAMTTRLLVGMFTPAIRATVVSPVAGAGVRPFSPLSVAERPQTPRRHPALGPGPGIVVVLMQNGCRVLMDSTPFRQPLPVQN